MTYNDILEGLDKTDLEKVKEDKDKSILFPSRNELNNNVEFAIYVPTTREGNIPIKPLAVQKRVKSVVEFVSSVFGGATISLSVGAWRGKKVASTEKIFIVKVSTDKITYGKYDERLKAFLKEKKFSWTQEAIFMEYNGKGILL